MNQDYKVNTNSEEVKRRTDEIFEIAKNLSQEELSEAVFNFARKKWHRINTATSDFKPESKGEENK